MAKESFEEKTEQPTPKKKEEVRKKGDVAKSRELPSVAVLLAGLSTLVIFGSYIYTGIHTTVHEAFSLMTLRELEISDFMTFANKIIGTFILTVLPLFAAIFVTAVLSNIAQVGFMLTGETIKPKLEKLNFIKGFGRLFSKQSLMELIKTLLKLAIVGCVAYLSVRSEMKYVPALGDMEVNEIVSYSMATVFKISIRCVLAMICLVAIDYAFQRWDFMKKIKMSKKEVKDELKKTEGDPLVKSRIRSIQMEMARRRMMQEVPKADVVITNPTHLAVAIKYDNSIMTAPRVLAKGAGEVAKRIRAVAEEHNVPVLEDKEVARSLYASVELGQEIPPDLYEAVAQILAHIYKLKGNHPHGLQGSRG